MVNIYIIIGKTNEGKSSTVRALTGVGSGAKILDIETTSSRTSKGRTLKTLVIHPALQEYHKLCPIHFVELITHVPFSSHYYGKLVKPTNEAKKLKKYIDTCHKRGNMFDSVLITLHPTSRKTAHNAQDYINHIIHPLIISNDIIILNNPFAITGYPTTLVPARPTNASNYTASEVRKFWGWL